MSKKVYIRTFGCQMNQADTEIITALLLDEGYAMAGSEDEADLIVLNTCAVRENAVEKILNQLDQLRAKKRRRPELLVGVIGCVPQYFREKLFAMAEGIDFLAGPDTYRELPGMIVRASQGRRPADFTHSIHETYAEIEPARPSGTGAFVPVMRGCNNMCAFCVVPFTRGRERSRPLRSVLDDVSRLASSGCREITLLGQNVNSYHDALNDCRFPELLEQVGLAAPDLRVRFTTSHPKDISPDLVRVIATTDNICNSIHLPVQSGSSRILSMMNRGHTREEYLDKIRMIRDAIPGVTLSTDLIAGFCGETLDDHRQTISLMEEVRFDFAYMFHYSVRPGTPAAKSLDDDVAKEEKKRRLAEIIELQNRISAECHAADIGSVVEVLVESESKRSSDMLMGRTKTNRVVVFGRKGSEPGDLVKVRILSATSATLLGEQA
ncbi:tRNA (N6-isopentenyl adenosine(37)-C2)-methylthiotransferase MiaB [Prosthecochloris sp. GSB1]|uniref:tRNA (N6-isopentenyl adenosine(37)-C2)-methylthiotransferase MiaB n=1 Tax=Prosthecochloris sp. GSB1 TaxID=281093 RepID=UPI000B8CE677|nr:tRNA (N6-isopentenyl adenosine(37)-C2)-methylthiotransferase MiaB [Prosthecochloris sp. GSB1]ASQ91292.1 tRNA (N6-isopentenyl adenosine(37)-C2)-methylthiotransferase MiaB [Prosthecochloris sp. GSB1]